VNRTFNAPRERVFRAWTVASELDRWFLPVPGAKVKSTLDAHVGGEYRIEVTSPDGHVHIATGVYREVDPPARLVFSWSAQGGPEPVENTQVTVEFFEADDGRTQVTLTHQNFGSAEMRNRHERGWGACLDQLGIFVG